MTAGFENLQTQNLIIGYIDSYSSDHPSSKTWEGYKVHTWRLFFVFCSHLRFIRRIQSDTQFNSTAASRVAVFNLLRLHTCSRRADGASQSVSVLCANIRFTVWNRLLQQRGGWRGWLGGREGEGELWGWNAPSKACCHLQNRKPGDILWANPLWFYFRQREQTHQPTGQFFSPQAQLLRNGEGSCLHPSEVWRAFQCCEVFMPLIARLPAEDC